ncbi:MAG: sugar transporter, partial [Sphingorhabdus sp.]
AWVAYALAVVAGTGAAIGLVFRKWWSTLLFGLSLIAVLIQFSYPFLVASSAQRGLDLLALPIFIVVMAVIQWQLSRHWQRKGWLA